MPVDLERPARVDPPGCGCTDCITGYSVPLDCASTETIRALVAGEITNATSTPLTVETRVWVSVGLFGEGEPQAWVTETREVQP